MRIEQVNEASPELVETISALLPQLTEARTPPTLGQLQDVVSNQTLLLARDDDGGILGTLTFVLYRVSSGVKGRIEDVIVDESRADRASARRSSARGCAWRTRQAC